MYGEEHVDVAPVLEEYVDGFGGCVCLIEVLVEALSRCWRQREVQALVEGAAAQGAE